MTTYRLLAPAALFAFAAPLMGQGACSPDDPNDGASPTVESPTPDLGGTPSDAPSGDGTPTFTQAPTYPPTESGAQRCADVGGAEEVVGLNPERCGGGEPQAEGPLCGDASPCEVVSAGYVRAAGTHYSYRWVDLTVSGEGVPSILALTGSSARLLVGDGLGGWALDSFTQPISRGALAPAPGGGLYVTETWPGSALWYRSPSGAWACAGPGPTQATFRDGVLRRDGAGCLYATVFGKNPEPVFMGVRQADWSLEELSPSQGQAVNGTLSLSPSGAPHFVGMVNGPFSELRWRGPDGGMETVAEVDFDSSGYDLVVVPGEGGETPWVSWTGDAPEGYPLRRLFLSERAGEDSWHHRVVATEPADEERCTHEPVADEICHLDFHTLSPAGLAGAADGSVRILYYWSRTTGELVGTCPYGRIEAESTPVDTSCRWEGSRTSTIELHVASPTAEGMRDRGVDVPGLSVSPYGSDVEVSPDGTLHLAMTGRGDVEGYSVFYAALR